jgi:probable HAF family extracellular repeat protein
VAVGTMKAGGGFSPWHAWIYKDGVVTNLNSLIPSGSGLHLRFADAINNKGQIVGVAFDAQGRHHAYLLTPVAEGTPLVDIGNASLTEGHSGTQSANLTLTLAPASSQTVTVTYTTANGNATAGTDYLADSGTVTFVPGQTTATISLLVNGDRVGEANETFLVNLSQPTGSAMVGDGQGVVTIVDDEPRVRINDVSRNEGHSHTTSFVFTVTLSPASDMSASVNFATADGSARVVEDYDARSGVLAFNPGETSKTIAVQVRGDKKSESEETFYVNLSAAQGALLAKGQGIGVIRNDDR